MHGQSSEGIHVPRIGYSRTASDRSNRPRNRDSAWHPCFDGTGPHRQRLSKDRREKSDAGDQRFSATAPGRRPAEKAAPVPRPQRSTEQLKPWQRDLRASRWPGMLPPLTWIRCRTQSLREAWRSSLAQRWGSILRNIIHESSRSTRDGRIEGERPGAIRRQAARLMRATAQPIGTCLRADPERPL